MPTVSPECFHQSASSIAAFKACPTRWRLLYREGLRPAADTDSQRIGTNWHSMHETYANFLASQLSCPSAADAAIEAVVAHLNERYATMPASKTPFEWGLERQILLTCFIGYLWYWQNDPVEFLHSELAFDLPVHAPRTGLPLPVSQVLRVGKIDHVIRWQNSVGALERKSTTRSIAPDSDYWDKSKKDTQVSMYALAFKDMADANVKGELGLPFVTKEGERFGNTLYDVFHRPTISPKMLTQADTKTFIETGKYFDQEFAVARDDETQGGPHIIVDGESAEVEIGKKAIAIRETIGMYGSRLLADIYERPDFYFARREIVRTDKELQKFRVDLYNIYQTQRQMDKTGHFYENESQCRATFPCSMIPICYGPGADAVCDGKTTPPGYKRIFVDLKVNGETIDAE